MCSFVDGMGMSNNSVTQKTISLCVKFLSCPLMREIVLSPKSRLAEPQYMTTEVFFTKLHTHDTTLIVGPIGNFYHQGLTNLVCMCRSTNYLWICTITIIRCDSFDISLMFWNNMQKVRKKGHLLPFLPYWSYKESHI